jgi:hypothetical protein
MSKELEEKIDQIIENPRESLSVELKDWIDPTNIDGKLKILKAVIAMRNNDGGIFIIGIKKDGSLNVTDAPDNVEQIFNVDDIQGLITKHSSESFEITICFRERCGKKFVGIAIPSGVKIPVAVKKPLVDNGKEYIHKNVVFVRSLDANNIPSTTKATYKDWANITDKCFENRESDIGRFLRRHLANVTSIRNLCNSFLEQRTDENIVKEEEINRLLKESLERFYIIVKDRRISIPQHGAMKVAAIINGKIKSFSTTHNFINLLLSSNPNYTGWPMWVDSRNFSDNTSHPYVFDRNWEAFIAGFGSDWSDHLDFWRIHPKGKFYLYRSLQDDIGGSKTEETRLKTLDFGLTILRVAEAIAVAIAFAKAMDADKESGIFFAFDWSKLKGRVLSSWANPARYLGQERISQQDNVISYIEVPINVPKSALYSYVHEVNKNVFELFNGFQVDESVTEDLVVKLLERKL